MVDPYYSDDHVTIYHGDCLDIIDQTGPIDLVLTSPPYNKGADGAEAGKEWSRLSNGYGTHGDDLDHAEYVSWQRSVIDACWSQLQPDGAIYYQHKPLIGGNEVRLPTELIPPGTPLRQIVVWDRGSGFNRNLTHYTPAYEWVLLLAKPDFRLTSRSIDDVWRIPANPDPEHPASFPLKLATKAIASTSARVVLDPFMGSGTTLRAAKDLNRKAVGIEIEERYCEIAARRMGQEVLAL